MLQRIGSYNFHCYYSDLSLFYKEHINIVTYRIQNVNVLFLLLTSSYSKLQASEVYILIFYYLPELQIFLFFEVSELSNFIAFQKTYFWFFVTVVYEIHYSSNTSVYTISSMQIAKNI